MKGESDTVAGLILELAGEFPTVQQVVKYKQFSFTALDIQKIVSIKYNPSLLLSLLLARKMYKFFFILLSCYSLGFTACNSKFTPKETGYPAVAFPKKHT